MVIFVKSVQRCTALAQLLIEQNFPAIAIHRGMNQEERLSRYQQFKDFQKVRNLTLFTSLIANICSTKLLMISAHFGCHQLVRAWHGHREGQHRVQLRHARGHRHLPSQGCKSRKIRNQRYILRTMCLLTQQPFFNTGARKKPKLKEKTQPLGTKSYL